MKYCNTCETEKDDALFGLREASSDGLAAKCKLCQRVYDKARSSDKHRVAAREVYAQTEIGKLAGNKAKAAYAKRNPKKIKAHSIVNNALRSGRLFREDCSKCGSSDNIHAHHDNYSKPLNIRWLCAICHAKHHALNGEAMNPK